MPYWIQIEIEPDGQFTCASIIDLDKVHRVHIIRENKTLQKIGITYHNETITYTGLAAKAFLKYWNAYCNTKGRVEPEAEPCIIQRAGKTSLV